MTTNKDDRFTSPKPAFKAPDDPYGVLVPVRKRFSEPSFSLKEQADNKKVAQLLAEAKVISDAELKEPIKETVKPPKVRYCAAHVMSDGDFIRQTRTMSIHDKGAMQMLFANGGEKYLAQGFLPAQAWDLLRKEKMNKMSKAPNASFDKHQHADGKGYVPGETVAERAAKIGMYLVKSENDK